MGGICVRGGLLWPFLVFCDLSQSATARDTVAVHFKFVSGDFHTISWFFSKIWMFWMECDILVWDETDFMVVSMISVWI